MQEPIKTYDAKVDAQRRGSAALAAGWTLLVFAMIAGIFVGQDVREGSHLFIDYAGVLALLGLIVIGYGNRLRRSNG
jgi:predicted benzoate:H+ symporter BenE